MGSIIHPWNLAMMFVVTSVAALVHSADGMDVWPVTEYGSEPRAHRHVDNAFARKGRGEHNTDGYEGTFKITIQVSDTSGSGTADRIKLQVVYKSAKSWGTTQKMESDNGFWAGYSYDFDLEATYYGLSDPVDKIRIGKDSGRVFDDAFFPEYYIINGPETCDRYKCDYAKICVDNPNGCAFNNAPMIDVPCELANESPSC